MQGNEGIVGVVTDRLMVDVESDGQVRVSSWLGDELSNPAVDSFALSWPLDDGALEDLRWYLEDYLRAPYGVYEDRGPAVAGKLASWGAAVFGAVFGSGPARDAYVQVRARAGLDTEVVFRSSDPTVLGLPWELMRDPNRPTPLALDLVHVTRSLPAAGFGEAFRSGERLRVLVVISRPSGLEDVGYRMIARPLLQQLEAVRGRVELDVLRPPTIKALQHAVTDALREGAPFQVVHFDGHGELPARRGPGLGPRDSVLDGDGAEGALMFEKPDGGLDEVPASRVAQVLKEGQVPVVVLNACQSGAIGNELEAAIATRLLQEGVASVVAMAYSVYAVAAAEFMAAFYERLFAGETVTQAVSAGRRQLHQRDKRPSPAGPMPLQDWVVPVHYRRRDVRFPELRTNREGPLSLDAALDRLRDRPRGEAGELDAVGSFVGRDRLFYELEVAARHQRVVVLHGLGGTGKTELAKAFGRWWRDTGGVEQPDHVILHSFEPGVASFGLDGVISEIGLRVYGIGFAGCTLDERLQLVQQALAEMRLLLIWDNFEAVRSMPDRAGGTPPLDGPSSEKLRAFVSRAAAGGKSSALITSRTDEWWLGDLRRIEVGGLIPAEASEYADQILAPYPVAAPRRATPAFAELLQWLGGHPLSMRLVLPYLEMTDPGDLLAGLQGTAALPGTAAGEDGDRLASLSACVAYSFEHLGASTRRLLVATCLFEGVTDARMLAAMAAQPGVPEPFAGVEERAWATALADAARVGLLTEIHDGMYRIHPALPGFLAALWRSQDPDEPIRRKGAVQALLNAGTMRSNWLDEEIHSGDAQRALALLDYQRRTLGHLLQYALEHGDWDHARQIFQPLDEYFAARGLQEEARGWIDRAQVALEDAHGGPPPPDSPGGILWSILDASSAGRESRIRRPGSEERRLLTELEKLNGQTNSKRQQSQLLSTYYELGVLTQRYGRLSEAEEWYIKSLAIATRLRDKFMVAGNHHQLGMVFLAAGRLDDAESSFKKALRFSQESTYGPGMANSWYGLGGVALDRGKPDQAEELYTKALGVWERLGDLEGKARSYAQLGRVAHDRGRLDDAERWYPEALRIFGKLGKEPELAACYHELGILAQDRARLDEAEAWYKKSLAINKELRYRLGLERNYYQLSSLAERQGNDWAALQRAIQCASLFEQFPHSANVRGVLRLARLGAKLGLDTVERCWQQTTGAPLPPSVRSFIAANPAGAPGTHRPQIGGPSMSDSVAIAARAAAERLSPEFGPALPAEVEAALETRGGTRPPERYDPAAIGSLIVSIATFAWMVYNDLRSRGSKPEPEAVARRTRIQFRSTDVTHVERRDRFIDATVEEIFREADRHE